MDNCFTELLTKWLRQINPPPTLTALASALRQLPVGHQQIAETLNNLGTFQNESQEVDVAKVIASVSLAEVSFPLLADNLGTR